jgi:hypothetical protein
MTESTDEDLKHARVLWDYHRLDAPLEPSEVIIGLGRHGVSVAQYAAELWHRGQRIVHCANKGFANRELLRSEVALAFARLNLAGYNSRIVS